MVGRDPCQTLTLSTLLLVLSRLNIVSLSLSPYFRYISSLTNHNTDFLFMSPNFTSVTWTQYEKADSHLFLTSSRFHPLLAFVWVYFDIGYVSIYTDPKKICFLLIWLRPRLNCLENFTTITNLSLVCFFDSNKVPIWAVCMHGPHRFFLQAPTTRTISPSLATCLFHAPFVAIGL